jgi:MoxR-like ATPase
MIAGRPSVGFEDVRAVAAPVLNHRVLLGYRARLDRVTSTAVVGQLLDALEETGSRLPTGATLLPSSGEAPPQTHESDGGV